MTVKTIAPIYDLDLMKDICSGAAPFLVIHLLFFVIKGDHFCYFGGLVSGEPFPSSFLLTLLDGPYIWL